MDSVVSAAVIYLVLLVAIRISGRRTLSETTTFDLALVLIISEATQQALLGRDSSVTNAIVVILTLIMLDVGCSHLKMRWKGFEKVVDGVPSVLVENGSPIRRVLTMSRIDESDILEAARRLRGIERMDQIRYAILEADGEITIIPQDRAPPAASSTAGPP